LLLQVDPAALSCGPYDTASMVAVIGRLQEQVRQQQEQLSQQQYQPQGMEGIIDQEHTDAGHGASEAQKALAQVRY